MISSSIEIDSFKIRIPSSKVKIIDSNFLDEFQKVSTTTGEPMDEPPEVLKKKLYEQPPLKLEVSHEVQSYFSKGRNISDEFICLKITSKHLKERYFEGITIDNIQIVYDTIISFQSVYFDIDVFLKSYVTDTDFKRDVIDSDNLFDETIDSIKFRAKSHKEKSKGYESFRSKDNKGIQFSSREKSTPTNPYLKFYHKGIELMSRSVDFKDTYLQSVPESQYINAIRQEITIKGRKHFRIFGINNTLFDVLSLSQEEKTNIMNAFIDKHLDKRFERIRVQDATLTPTDVFLYGWAQSLVQLNLSKDKIVDIIVESLSDSSKSRYRPKIESYLSDSSLADKLTENEKLSSFMQGLNL